MDSTAKAVLIGAVVVAGRWAQKEELNVRIGVGAVSLAVFLAAMGAYNPKLGNQFGNLILVTALAIYAVPIAKVLYGPTAGQPR